MPYTGLELYKGPSRLDGQPIVVILTLHSDNRKTGDMCQTWILRQDMAPQEAVKQGADESVCGQCSKRHHLDGDCYVLPFQAPNQVYQSWRKGNYPVASSRDLKRLRGRAIRFGAYGDPAAAPDVLWKHLASLARMTTGYTHQVSRTQGLPLLDLCMVSADSEAEAAFYQTYGLRTFRVKRPDEPLLEGEVYCPADTRKDVMCIDCGICNGANQDGPSVAINAHGQRSERASRYERIAAKEVA